MQTVQTTLPVFCEDTVGDVTLAAQTWAVERAIQAMHTHLHELLTLENLADGCLFQPLSFQSRLSPSDWHSPWRISLGSALPGGPAFAVDHSAQRDRYLLRGWLYQHRFFHQPFHATSWPVATPVTPTGACIRATSSRVCRTLSHDILLHATETCSAGPDSCARDLSGYNLYWPVQQSHSPGSACALYQAQLAGYVPVAWHS